MELSYSPLRRLCFGVKFLLAQGYPRAFVILLGNKYSCLHWGQSRELPSFNMTLVYEIIKMMSYRMIEITI